jgi:hypothetical protein
VVCGGMGLRIMVAHPAKLQCSRETDKHLTLSLYDSSNSAHWPNKPDIGVAIHRDSLEPLHDNDQGEDPLLRRDRDAGRGEGAAVEPGGDEIRAKGGQHCVKRDHQFGTRPSYIPQWHDPTPFPLCRHIVSVSGAETAGLNGDTTR